MKTREIPNDEIADVLDRLADLLEVQEADSFRVRAYREAAKTVLSSNQSIAEMALVKDDKKLEDLPDIGKSIGGAIREYVTTGRLIMLERLEGQVSPEALFATIPGIGEEFAQRIHEELKVDTLEELEVAANDGRLEGIPGMGERRVKGIRDTLASMLRRSTRRRARRFRQMERTERQGEMGLDGQEPAAGLLLKMDEEYREKAKADRLRKIAPKRFNPSGEAWLPIMHKIDSGWSFTVLFSNTARAHELKKTHDWVVIFYEKDGQENQCTVVTEHKGPLQGKRVIRGREQECKEFYGM